MLRKDKSREWQHLKNTGRLPKDAVYKIAMKRRTDLTLIDEGLKAPKAKPAPLLGKVVTRYTDACVDST